MTEPQVKHAIAIAYEYCYLHDDWVTPVEEALDGLGLQPALRRPTPQSKCIWEIVLHVANWNENIVQRTKSREKARPAEGAWPKLPERADEQAWKDAKVRLWRSLDAVRDLIRESTLDELNAGPYGIGDLFCRFTHTAYHLGQIVKQREIMEET